MVEAPYHLVGPDRWSAHRGHRLQADSLRYDDDEYDDDLYPYNARPPPGPRRGDRSLSARQQRVRVKQALSIAAVHRERHRTHLGQWSGPGSPAGGGGGGGGLGSERGVSRPTSERPHGELKTREALATSMQRRHGSVLRGFRRELDLRGKGYVSFADLTKFFHRLGPGYKAHPLWANLGRSSTADTSPPLRLRELEATEADNLESFVEALANVAPFDLQGAWDLLDLENQCYLTLEAFSEASEALGFRGNDDVGRLFRGLDRDGHGRIYFADLEYAMLVAECPGALGFRSAPAVVALKFQDLIHFVHQEFASVDDFLRDLGLDASNDGDGNGNGNMQPPSHSSAAPPSLADSDLDRAAKLVVDAAGTAAAATTTHAQEEGQETKQESKHEFKGSLLAGKDGSNSALKAQKATKSSISVHHLASGLRRQGFPGDCILLASQVCRAGSRGGREVDAKVLCALLLPEHQFTKAAEISSKPTPKPNSKPPKPSALRRTDLQEGGDDRPSSPSSAASRRPNRTPVRGANTSRPPFDSRITDFSMVQADLCPVARTSVARLQSFSPSPTPSPGKVTKKAQRSGSGSNKLQANETSNREASEKQLAAVALDAAQAAVTASEAATLAAQQARRCLEDSWQLPGPSNPGLAVLDSVLTQLESRCPEDDEELVAMLDFQDDEYHEDDQEGWGEPELERSLSTPSLHPDHDDPRFSPHEQQLYPPDFHPNDDRGYDYEYEYGYGYYDSGDCGDPRCFRHPEQDVYSCELEGSFREHSNDDSCRYSCSSPHYYYEQYNSDNFLDSGVDVQREAWERSYWEDPVETARRRVQEAKGRGRGPQDPPRWCTCSQKPAGGHPRRGPAADFRSARPSGRPRLQQ